MNLYKTGLTIFIIFLISLSVIGQNKVDEVVINSYPKKFATIEKLASRIKSDFNTQEDQTRALFCWMAHNIRYDVKEMYNQKAYSYTYRSEKEKKEIERKFLLDVGNKTLNEKKGVCDGYSKLFKLTCEELAIECEVVPGFSRVYLSDLTRKYSHSDHAWNAIKLDEKWYLVDVTWGAGYIDENMQFQWFYNPVFFKGTPEQFFRNHYPEDKKWLLCDKTLEQFANQPVYYNSTVTKDTELIAPIASSVSTKNGVEIKLTTSLDPNKFYYAYDSDAYLQELNAEENGNILVLKIKKPSKKSKYLTIYYDTNAIISFLAK